VKHWEFLKKGDCIDVVAPGYPSKPEEVDGAASFLEKWGLKPHIPKKLIQPHFLHANDDIERFTYLKKAVENPNSDVIWCLRGGYGSNRLLPFLAKLKKPKKSKLLIGISDITSLHTFVIQEWGWKTLHAPLLDRLGRNLVSPQHEKELHDLLFGKKKRIEFKKLKPLNEAAKAVVQIDSQIVGGNLTVLQSSLATPWQIQTKGKILFLEDIGERGYRIDRMFEQFRQAGLFKACRALVLGDFVGAQEPQSEHSTLPKVLRRWSQDLDIPLFTGLEAGHAPVQRPVPLNTNCQLQVTNSRGLLSIESGGA
jgi:muramoyltetrapeptide carboxypeptidase